MLAAVTFAWDANPETNIAKYVLYRTSDKIEWAQAGVQTNIAAVTWTNDVGQVETGILYKAESVPPGTNWFVVTAVNDQGLESDHSNQVEVRVPTAPQRLRINTKLQGSASVGGPWIPLVDLGEVELDATNQASFYRGWLDIELIP